MHEVKSIFHANVIYISRERFNDAAVITPGPAARVLKKIMHLHANEIANTSQVPGTPRVKDVFIEIDVSR